MRHHLGHLRTVQPTLRQHPTDNRILISLGDVPARHDDIVQEQPRVGAVLSRIGQLALRQGSLEPLRFDNGDQGIVRIVKGWEVDCAGHEVGEIRQRGEGRWGLVDDRLGAIFFEGGRNLDKTLVH